MNAATTPLMSTRASPTGRTGAITVSNGTLPAADVRDEQLAAVEITVLAVIFVTTVVSNSFVLVALWRQMKFCPKSRMYLFMLHLSVADLLVAFFSLLPQMIWKITFRFHGGDLLCRSVKYMQVMVIYLSTYILVMMAVDRYRAICWAPSNLHWNSLRLAKLLVASAWVLSLLLAVPQPLIFRMTELKEGASAAGVHDCWVVFDDAWQARAYVTWFVVSAFAFPFLVLAFCYGFISYRIWTYNPDERYAMTPHKCTSSNGLGPATTTDGTRQQQSTPSARILPPPPAEQSANGVRGFRLRRTGRNHISHAKLKTIKLTFIVVACFFLCWSPFCVTQLIMVYNPPDKTGAVETICLLLACLNSCTNPWIYLTFSGSLLNHLRVCLGIGIRRARDNDSIGDEEPEPRPKPDRPHGSIPRHGNNKYAAPESGKMASTKSDVV